MPAKAKKSVKKSAKIARGKKIAEVKPLTNPGESFSFNYGSVKPTYGR